MRLIKLIFGIGIIAIFCAVGIIYLHQSSALIEFWDSFRPKGEQSINIQASPPKRVDRLFTTFIYMPIINYKKEDDNTTIKGLCSIQYEVGIGYEDTLKLSDQYQDAACKNDVEAMPNPSILSSNAVESVIKGEYDQTECDALNAKNPLGIRRKSHEDILLKLGEEGGQWNKIVSNSKQILTSYLRSYCSEETSKN